MHNKLRKNIACNGKYFSATKEPLLPVNKINIIESCKLSG